jgi:hypothetical protein
MVVALIALFAALFGTAYAANKISGKTIRVGSEPGNRLVADSVGGKQVNEGSLAVVHNIVPRQGTAVQIPAGGTADAFAKCDPGEKLVGGGGAPLGVFGNGGNGGFIQFDGPDVNVPNQWQMKAFSTGGATLQVTAYCQQ